MGKYKFTIIYSLVVVMPFVAYLIWSLHNYVFFGNTPPSADRIFWAFFGGAILSFPAIAIAYHEELKS
jgi:hypothetical protein